MSFGIDAWAASPLPDAARAGPIATSAPAASVAPRRLLQSVDAPSLLGVEVASAAVRFDRHAWTPDQSAKLGVHLPERLEAAALSRKSEFVAGRFCAREALLRLGHPTETIHSSVRGAPIWPHGLVGSITHTRDFASAVVARERTIRSLGIDSERIIQAGTAERLAKEICGYSPRWLSDGNARALHVTLVFSAKESLFKCLYPLVRREFWFSDSHIDLKADNNENFDAILVTDLGIGFRRGTKFAGRYVIDPPFVHTGVALI